MNSLWMKTLVLAMVLPIAGLVLMGSPTIVGQEKPAAKKEVKTAKAKHILPAYYGDVVSEEQRKQIYAIQDKYADELKALNEQLLSVVKKQNDQIEGVLTAEQKDKIDKDRAEATAKKKKKAAAKKAEQTAKPAETK